jgi:IMP dehydrogenase/GMP reductase
VEKARNALPDVQLVAGNIASTDGARALVERGVDVLAEILAR